MDIRVCAEFESVDHAEPALRRIKHEVEGVRKISLLSEKVNYEKTTEMVAYPFSAVTETFGMVAAGAVIREDMPQDKRKDHTRPEPFFRQTVTLQVLCDSAASHQVSAIITSKGGSNVRLRS